MRHKKCADDICYIYVLIDPITSETRYVGKSVYPKTRFSAHIYDAMNPISSFYPESHKNRWIRKLAEQNQKPQLLVIEETTCEKSDEREIYWIKFYGRNSLTNMTDGGGDKNHFYNWDIYDHDKLKENIKRIRSKLCRRWIKRRQQSAHSHLAMMYGIDYEQAKSNNDGILDGIILTFNNEDVEEEYTMSFREWANQKPPYDTYTDEECYEICCDIDFSNPFYYEEYIKK